ncbi:MAG: XrtA/PEP-CTERM system histidine kinase PrsK [Aquisalimonadaceae bacterium]
MSTIGALSYGICAIAFVFLAGLITVSWRGGAHGALLVVASAVTGVWAGVVAWASWYSDAPAFWVELLELLRTALWLVFMGIMLRPLRARNPLIRLLTILAFFGPPLAIGLVLWQQLGVPLDAAPLAEGVHGLFIIAGLLLALLGLVLVEQIYRNLPAERRWAMKFLCLGAGILFGYDLYLYSDALLFRQLDLAVWHARGVVQALAVPLIAVAAARNRSWSLQVFVSRHVAFHTAAIFAAGSYLVVISLGGYYIRDFGGSWGGFAQIVLVAAAAVALVVVLASGDMQARLKLFLSKHFFRNKYDYREEWLRLTNRLADENDGLTPYERAIRVVADIVGSPAGAVWYRREDAGYVATGGWNLQVPDAAVASADAPLVAFLQSTKWIVDVAEYHASPEHYGSMEVPEWLTAMDKPWAIIPLLLQEDLVGFMVLTRPDVNTEITWEDRDLLKTLGRQVASYLGQHENAQALSRARQFEAFNQLTAFLMHDLKNLIAQQSLMLKNAEKHKHNPAFIDDAMATVGHSVSRMERLLEHLQRRQARGVIERVDAHWLLEEAARRCADREPRPALSLAAEGRAVEADAEELAMVLVHLIRNAQDATPVDGKVTATVVAGDGGVTFEVADSGSGMTPEFIRDELFRPFHTTKSSKGMGIGAYQARDVIRRSGGRLEVASEPGAGTRFRFTLPVVGAGDADLDSTQTATGI